MKTLFLLEDIEDNDIIELKNEEVKIIVFDYHSHKILKKYNIKHNLLDDYIKNDEREKIFPFVKSLLGWHKNFNNNELNFCKIDLLSIIDRNEFLEVLMDIIPKTVAIKNIFEQNSYSKVFASRNIFELLKNNQKNELNLFGKKDGKSLKLSHDEISSSLKIGIFKLNLKIKRKKLLKIKSQYEKTVGSLFRLTKEISTDKKIILLEINPEIYSDFLMEMKRQKIQPVLINFRRPAIWSLETIKILNRTNSLVVIPEKFLEQDEFKKITQLKENFLQKINVELTNNSKKMEEIFQYNEIKFDQIMNQLISKIFQDRIDEYLTQIFVANKVSKFENVLAMISLNLSGETEQVFSKIIKNCPIILTQHAFSNYNNSISFYDFLDDFHLIKDKIAIYGNIVKNYLMKIKSIPENKIIVCGSPKYDSYFNSIKPKNNKKKILITPRPIINHMEGIKISLYEEYEKIIKDVVNACKKNENIEIIFKLHPQQHPHNDIIRKIIQENFPEIQIYQNHSIKNLLLQSNLHINIASDNFDASTVILEAMILKCPTLNIQLQDTEFNFEFVQMNAIRSIRHTNNLELEISELINNEGKRDKLLKNSKKFLNEYLSNHGNASNYFINEIINLKY